MSDSENELEECLKTLEVLKPHTTAFVREQISHLTKELRKSDQAYMALEETAHKLQEERDEEKEKQAVLKMSAEYWGRVAAVNANTANNIGEELAVIKKERDELKAKYETTLSDLIIVEQGRDELKARIEGAPKVWVALDVNNYVFDIGLTQDELVTSQLTKESDKIQQVHAVPVEQKV